MWQSIYSHALLPLFLAGARISAKKNEKTRASLQGREGLWDRIQTQLASRQSTPLIWFHVASAGEYLQASPVMERLMAAGYQCALTVTSITGFQWASKRKNNPGLVLVDYLPFDTVDNARRMLNTLKPSALVHVKFDLWPNLIWETKRAGIPQFLISATLHAKSKRITSMLGRSLYRSVYQNIDHIYAVSDTDTRRFLNTAPSHPSVKTLGDTRFDSVLDRRNTIKPPVLPDCFTHGRMLVLGSIWPADEEHIIPVVKQAMVEFPDLILAVVPHEVGEDHLKAIENSLSGISLRRLTANNETTDTKYRCLLVDTVGQLSSLYHYATIAYVGGAFGKGVHNTMEPCAMGVTTLFGPFYQNSPEAEALLAEKLCFTISDSTSFREVLFGLLKDSEKSRAIGADAKRWIEGQAGAADRCFIEIKEAVDEFTARSATPTKHL